jgi:hypothetical protein
MHTLCVNLMHTVRESDAYSVCESDAYRERSAEGEVAEQPKHHPRRTVGYRIQGPRGLPGAEQGA